VFLRGTKKGGGETVLRKTKEKDNEKGPFPGNYKKVMGFKVAFNSRGHLVTRMREKSVMKQTKNRVY